MKIINASIVLAVASLVTQSEALSARRQLFQASPFKWPLYSQQCFDDAGPPFVDDVETYGPNGHYHDNSQAVAVLQNGECAGPIKEACQKHAGNGQVTADVARTAYLEGPVQCGGRGWFCRILPDVNHHNPDSPKIDWNFNHCNRTDYGDTDGHCHGSDNDDVFYWWARDHWHRNYAGRLHCCCDWRATAGVVARCDYRAPLQPGENTNCRDANEDHTGPGSGFSLGYEAGCSNLGTTQALPEPPQDQCWTVLNFAPGGGSGGFVFDDGSGPTTAPEDGGDGEDGQTNDGDNEQEDNGQTNEDDSEQEDIGNSIGDERPSVEEEDDSTTGGERPSVEETEEVDESPTGEGQSTEQTGEGQSVEEEDSEWHSGEESNTGEGHSTEESHTGEAQSTEEWHTGESTSTEESDTVEDDERASATRTRPRNVLFGRRGRL